MTAQGRRRRVRTGSEGHDAARGGAGAGLFQDPRIAGSRGDAGSGGTQGGGTARERGFRRVHARQVVEFRTGPCGLSRGLVSGRKPLRGGAHANRRTDPGEGRGQGIQWRQLPTRAARCHPWSRWPRRGGVRYSWLPRLVPFRECRACGCSWLVLYADPVAAVGRAPAGRIGYGRNFKAVRMATMPPP